MRRRGIMDSELLEGRDEQGRTPLFCAAQRGHTQVVAALMAVGAERDERCKLQPSVRLIATLPLTVMPQRFREYGEIRAAQPAVSLEKGVVSIGGEKFPLEHGIVGAPAVKPVEGRWRYEVEIKLNQNPSLPIPNRRYVEVMNLGFCVGWSSQDARQIRWNHVSDSADAALESYDIWSAWWQNLGVQLGTNDWSCGLRDSGEWGSPSGAAPRAEGSGSKPNAAAHVPIDGKRTVGMLLDCHARTAYVSTGAEWMEHDVSSLAEGMFPAVSWMGCHGELSFNFGERPWQCEAATPGGDRFRPISEAGSGNTPVMEAASEGHMEVCSLLMESAAVEDVGRRHQRTLLHWAAWWGDVELARRVLEVSGNRDACMRATDGDGLNAVWHAAERGHAEVLRVLWDTSLSLKGVSSAGITSETSGADFNLFAREGRTPAHVAAEGGFVEALRVLKEAGADLSHVANGGRTPAHWAAEGGHVEALRVIYKVGADLSHADNIGWTPAHSAAAGGHVEALR
eukprot:gene34548-biopygen33158